ncbi:MAG: nucleotidyltransferase domain-containing protein [Candidatus Woesearchaeota archaeon]
MEFKIEKKENPHIRKYSQKDLDTSREFAKKIVNELGTFCKAIVLFGSAARRDDNRNDIDIMVAVDDLTIVMTSEGVEAYRIIMQKLVADTDTRIHLTTLKLSNLWDLVRKGDPVAINILRDGVALIDSGFFDPLQALLYQGRIGPSYEAVYTYLHRAPASIVNSKWHLLQATVDLYWATIDAAHAALMKMGHIPPSPSHVADMLDQKLVKKGLLEQRYCSIMRNFYEQSKRILHGEQRQVHGEDYEKLLKDAQDFVDRMKRIVQK